MRDTQGRIWAAAPRAPERFPEGRKQGPQRGGWVNLRGQMVTMKPRLHRSLFGLADAIVLIYC